MTITCPACRAVHVQGTLFCEQCGASLIGAFDATQVAQAPFPPSVGVGADGDVSTGALDNPATLPLDTVQDRATGAIAPTGVPTRLRMLILNTGRLTEWIDEPTIHVGRGDRTANVFPTVDLELDGGHNAGVSRRHVRVLRQPDGYYLEDLGSINGTFLNRRRLSPGTPTELKDGDEVRLGNIVLRIVLGGYTTAR